MALVLITPPVIEPVDLVTAKNHLRVTIAEDDALIGALIVAARRHVEVITRRQLLTATWELALDRWPQGNMLWLPLPPLQGVTSITYRNEAGALFTMPPADYVVDTAEEPGRIASAHGRAWPSGGLFPVSAIRVRFTAGYGATAVTVPETIRQAMLLLVGHWYETREATITETIMREVPFAVEALLWPYRVLRWL